MGITVQVPVGTRPNGSPYIRGRNGYFEITALRIHQWGTDDPDPKGEGAVDIHGIGKRGKPIRGGFGCLRADEIDALCKAWIEARGGFVIMPSDEDIGAFVTTHNGVVESLTLGRNLDELTKLRDQYVAGRDPDQHAYAIERLEWAQMVAGESLLLVPAVGIAPDVGP